MNYYNENEPFAAEWLRNLIDDRLIQNGIVDERSIKEVTPSDVRGFRQCHFFAGISGWSLALQLAEWPDDQEVWTGSCPCQPFSNAGSRKGAGDERHLWPEFFRLIEACNPAVVMGEQVASSDGLGWLDGVFTDLENENYTCWACDLCAASVGAPHIRQRLYWVGNSNGARLLSRCKAAAPARPWHSTDAASGWDSYRIAHFRGGKTRRISSQSSDEPLVNGIPRDLGRGESKLQQLAIRTARANQVGRIKGYGNAIVPEVAARFVRAFLDRELAGRQ